MIVMFPKSQSTNNTSNSSAKKKDSLLSLPFKLAKLPFELIDFSWSLTKKVTTSTVYAPVALISAAIQTTTSNTMGLVNYPVSQIPSPNNQTLPIPQEKHVSWSVSDHSIAEVPPIQTERKSRGSTSSRRSSSSSVKRYSPNRPSPLHKSSSNLEDNLDILEQAPEVSPLLPTASLASTSTVVRPRAASSSSTLSNESSTLASSAVSEPGISFTASKSLNCNTDVKDFSKQVTTTSPSGKKPSLLTKMIAESDDKTLLHHAVARRRRQMMRYQSSPDMVVDGKMDLETYESVVAPMIEAKQAAQGPARRVATYTNLSTVQDQDSLHRGHSSEVNLRQLTKDDSSIKLGSSPKSQTSEKRLSYTPSWTSDSVLNPEIRGMFRPRAGSTSSRASRTSSHATSEEEIPQSAGPRLESSMSNAW